ncbi:MAG: glutamyl-tRNA reductase [archaeon]|nr:glutamyl-tRNA reductase [archaeon]MCP8316448.1 glutamyl-tRNA reductase [archaeon]
MHSSTGNINIVNVRITHKKSRVTLMEAVAFKDRKGALTEIRSMANNIDECVLLQTCNRVELYTVGKDGEKIAKMLSEYLINRAGSMAEEASRAIEISLNQDALRHILRVASGLESMIVGEDQILSQVWDAYLEAESVGMVGPVLKTVFSKAVSVGRLVRNETGINKGAVSIGSAAVELAESLLGNLNEKKVLVIGAGETGTLVAKALARRYLNAIFVANRTYERALKLAEELCGKAVKFDRLEEALIDADVVICSTSAPHYLLTRELVCGVMKQRHSRSDLMIIDISNPRNVEKSVQDIEGVKLHNIDDLQMIAEKNKEERQKSVEKASKIIDEELPLLDRDLKAQSVRNIISSLFLRTEEVRQRELMKALNMLGNIDEKERKIIDDLTCILVKQTFVPIIENLRIAAMNNDKQLIDVAVKLFGMEAS